VKERGIIMQAESVRGILAGRKTQTRRIVDAERLRVKLPEPIRSDLWDEMPASMRRVAKAGVRRATVNPQFAVAAVLPDGKELGLRPGEFDFVCQYADCVTRYRNGGWKLDPIGDQRLWVRETWRTIERLDAKSPAEMAAACREAGWDSPWAPIEYLADGKVINDDTGEEPWGKKRGSLHMPRWASRLTLDVTRIRIERLQEITEEDAIAEGIQRNIGLTHFCGAPHRAHGCPRQHNTAREAYADLWDSINGARARWTTNPWVWMIDFKVAEAAKGFAA
jgi:hypothetical protein